MVARLASVLGVALVLAAGGTWVLARADAPGWTLYVFGLTITALAVRQEKSLRGFDALAADPAPTAGDPAPGGPAPASRWRRMRVADLLYWLLPVGPLCAIVAIGVYSLVTGTNVALGITVLVGAGFILAIWGAGTLSLQLERFRRLRARSPREHAVEARRRMVAAQQAAERAAENARAAEQAAHDAEEAEQAAQRRSA